jgi:SNF family Na+-dependent transporter
MLMLLATWMITYFCVFKGVKSSSYVVWFTVPGPIVFIFIMVMNNLSLPNADAGIRMYLRGENADGTIDPPGEKLANGQMWADAVGQIFFSLGVCMGVMTSYSSYNRKNKPIIRDVLIISFGNCGLSFFAGFAVFSVVGYLQYLDSPVKSNTSSSGLAFIAYPAAAEEMPGSNFWILLLGITLFTLGIDTAFSLVEAISTVVYDTEKGKSVPRKLTALIVCILGWLGSLLFCPSWGYTHFDVADRYISVYLMFVLGIMQCFAAAWAFRFQVVYAGEDKKSIQLLSYTYWITLIILGPVTVFGLGPAINIPQWKRDHEDY